MMANFDGLIGSIKKNGPVTITFQSCLSDSLMLSCVHVFLAICSVPLTMYVMCSLMEYVMFKL